MKINNKAFTLVELLVSISIMGIIIVIALPTISNIQAKNKNMRYEKYSDALVSAAKLYTDSNSIDMFGYEGQGCYDVTFEQLEEKKLIKDIDYKDITCADRSKKRTYVRVKKAQGEYSYQASIACNNDSGTDEYEKLLTESDAICTEEGVKTPPILSISPNGNSAWEKNKDYQVSIKVSDNDGLLENIEIEYAWTKTLTATGLSYTRISFKNKRDVKSVTRKVKRPSADGIYYLIVKPVNVFDVFNNAAIDRVESKEFKFDSTPPSVPTIVSSANGNWAKSVKLTLKSKDNLSGIAYYRYKYGKDGSYKNYSDSAKEEFVTPNITTEMNDSIYISACDKAGNCSTDSSTKIKIDNTAPSCSIDFKGTVGNNGWYKEKSVSVSLTKQDNGKVKSNLTYNLTTSTTPSYSGTASGTQGNTAGVTWYGYVKDEAGNVGSCSKSLKVDTSPPTCNTTLSNANWTNQSVTVTGVCNDGTGGSGCTGNSQKTFNTQMNEAKSPGDVYDKAGNKGTCGTKTVRIDKTAPSCSVNFSGTVGTNDWYKGNDVSVSLIKQDNGTIKSNLTYNLTTSTTPSYGGTASGTQGNTTGTTWYGYVKDEAGNVGSCSKSLKVDTSPPTVSFNVTSIVKGNALGGNNISDSGGSGIAKYAFYKDGSNQNYITSGFTDFVVTADTSCGDSTYKITAYDNAGNATTVSKVFLSPNVESSNVYFSNIEAAYGSTAAGGTITTRCDYTEPNHLTIAKNLNLAVNSKVTMKCGNCGDSIKETISVDRGIKLVLTGSGWIKSPKSGKTRLINSLGTLEINMSGGINNRSGSGGLGCVRAGNYGTVKLKSGKILCVVGITSSGNTTSGSTIAISGGYIGATKGQAVVCGYGQVPGEKVTTLHITGGKICADGGDEDKAPIIHSPKGHCKGYINDATLQRTNNKRRFYHSNSDVTKSKLTTTIISACE